MLCFLSSVCLFGLGFLYEWVPSLPMLMCVIIFLFFFKAVIWDLLDEPYSIVTCPSFSSKRHGLRDHYRDMACVYTLGSPPIYTCSLQLE
ncbi:hypothetical protein EDC01DRAFT_643846 [Geopyxis carbonaria]|nr:hypothetical protein EDC01DRAFT_643846 [Geopyxis carbonaria]